MTGPNLDQAPLEPGDLPSSYGSNKLVLLPVDPYLIHVYWDLASTSAPGPGVRPILRFYESPASANLEQSRPFDVDIDFTTSSWYVNLWSPDKIYYADVGWRAEDGTFIQLARSNTVLTPPAWPRPANPVEATEPDPAPVAAAAPVDVALEPEPPQEPTLVTATPEPPPTAPVRPRSQADEFLSRRLGELFAIRGDLPPIHEPVELAYDYADDIPGEPSQLDAPLPHAPLLHPWSGLEELDLTQLSEERFTPGISSEWNSLGE